MIIRDKKDAVWVPCILIAIVVLATLGDRYGVVILNFIDSLK